MPKLPTVKLRIVTQFLSEMVSSSIMSRVAASFSITRFHDAARCCPATIATCRLVGILEVASHMAARSGNGIAG